MGERGGSGGGAKSYDLEKARSSINHSILSGVAHIVLDLARMFPE